MLSFFFANIPMPIIANTETIASAYNILLFPVWGFITLSNVYVEESSRNNGLGTLILKAAEKVAETIGAKSIRLKVKRGSPVKAWYRKHGYDYIAFEDGYDWLEKTLEYSKSVKQEWSEEDEGELQNAIDCLEYLGNGGVYASESGYDAAKNAVKFLKSLTERFNLQPNQEWSEEDENAILIAIDWLQYYRDTFVASEQAKDEITTCVERLKSLRPQSYWKQLSEKNTLGRDKCYIAVRDSELSDEEKEWAFNFLKRCEPKSHWKPSEAQMNSLQEVINILTNLRRNTGDRYNLESLYKQLENL